MKTLKEIAKKDKRNLVTKKDGSLKSRVIEAIQTKVFSNKIYFQSWTNKGRHLVSYEYELTNLLKLAGYKFTYGNDAPFNGKDGDFLKVSDTALKFLLNIKESK